MLLIRAEEPGDYGAIHAVNKAAFDRDVEANLVERLRSRWALTVSLVAMDGIETVGHIVFTAATLRSAGGETPVLALAPMAVLPTRQKQGIGSRLVAEGLETCRRLGCGLVFVLGHPGYYPRFGFIPAATAGISCEFDVPDEAFMYLELRDGALDSVPGTVYYQPEFGEAE